MCLGVDLDGDGRSGIFKADRHCLSVPEGGKMRRAGPGSTGEFG